MKQVMHLTQVLVYGKSLLALSSSFPLPSCFFAVTSLRLNTPCNLEVRVRDSYSIKLEKLLDLSKDLF